MGRLARPGHRGPGHAAHAIDPAPDDPADDEHEQHPLGVRGESLRAGDAPHGDRFVDVVPHLLVGPHVDQYKPRLPEAGRDLSSPCPAITAEDWSLPAPLRVRMGMHSGLAEMRDGLPKQAAGSLCWKAVGLDLISKSMNSIQLSIHMGITAGL